MVVSGAPIGVVGGVRFNRKARSHGSPPRANAASEPHLLLVVFAAGEARLADLELSVGALRQGGSGSRPGLVVGRATVLPPGSAQNFANHSLTTLQPYRRGRDAKANDSESLARSDRHKHQ